MTTRVKPVRQASSVPTRKVAVGGLAGAITFIAVWVLNNFDLLPGGKDVPGDVAAALTTLLTFVISYLVPPSARDTIL
jgi:hypothetical protein